MTTAIQIAEAGHISELLDRCRGGETTAWQQLYAEHAGFVYRSARRLGCPADECDDVVQETFLRAFRKLDQFREGKLTTWLYRIAANVVSEHHRRRRRRSKLEVLFRTRRSPDPEPPRADERLQSQQLEALVTEVFAEMKPRHREVFVLFEVEGLTGEQVAERVGCKLNTVWTRLHHARRVFKRLAKRKGMLRGIS